MAEIRPEEIIDTSENRPIEEKTPQPQTEQTQPPQTQHPLEGLSASTRREPENTTPPVFEVKATRVKDLTTEERLRLISDAKNGIDNPYFKVQFFKNGNSRITKRKQPVEQTSERIIKQRSPGLTTEQLLMEHVIGLESQLAVLKQKHKKLKKNYKNMYQDVYVDDEADIDARALESETQSNNNNTTPTTNALNDIQDKIVNSNECLQGEQQPPSSEFPQQQNIFNQNKTKGWRARIAANMY